MRSLHGRGGCRSLSWFLLVLVAAPSFVHAAGKMTVCTITIHSDDEKLGFERSLSKKDFQFVELAPKRSAHEDPGRNWLSSVCRARKGLKCDLLMISGHFGGNFFGENGPDLKLPDLEQASCDPACRGIFESPQEVFLFGCNTLAGKQADSRTPDEYLRVLLADGIPRGEAEMAVELRYGALGISNRDRFRQIFHRVPHIYGFHSVAPLGEEIAPSLSAYLARKPDYAGHLERQAVEASLKDLEGLNRKSSAPPPNRALASELSEFNFSQCAGTNPAGVQDPVRAVTCALGSNEVSLKEKLGLIRSLVSRGEFMKYFHVLRAFAEEHDLGSPAAEERAVIQRISKYTRVRDQILAQIRKTKLPAPRLALLGTAARFGILSAEDVRREAMADFKTAQKGQGFITHHPGQRLAFSSLDFSVEDLTPEMLKSTSALSLLGTTSGRDPALLAKLREIALTTPSETKDALTGPPLGAAWALRTFYERGIQGAEREFFSLLESKNPVIRTTVLQQIGFSRSFPKEPESVLLLVRAAGSPRDPEKGFLPVQNVLRTVFEAGIEDAGIRTTIEESATRRFPKEFAFLNPSGGGKPDDRAVLKGILANLKDFTTPERGELRLWSLVLASSMANRPAEFKQELARILAGRNPAQTLNFEDQAYLELIRRFLAR